MHTTVHIYVMTLTSANERPRCMYIIYYAHTIFSAANANYVLFENRDTIYIGGFLNLVKPRRIGFALNYTRVQNLSILVVISQDNLPKIFNENCAIKGPSVGQKITILAIWLRIILEIKLFFFKIESRNFQHLFDLELRETSQNVSSLSLYRQILFRFFFYGLSE